MSDLLDEMYTRLRTTGPELDGWLSNHGPMAADALLRMGCGEEVETWVEGYAVRLREAPGARWPIEEGGWRDVLGDPSRLGDWCALFDRLLADEPWADVLVRWWPRLVDGAVASASHGLIRTGHAVRALREHTTPARLAELAHALGYWAARHQRLPSHGAPCGTTSVGAALDAVPVLGGDGGIRSRLDDLRLHPDWPATVSRLHPPTSAAEVPGAIDDLVDAALCRYGRWAHGNPVMLVHAATAPRAAGLVLPALPEALWPATFEAAWAVSAAIATAYRPRDTGPGLSRSERAVDTAGTLADRALGTGDEHAIKLAEVAIEAHRRGNRDALAVGARAAELIGRAG